MRNPSGGAPQFRARFARLLEVSIDEKPVRRCARAKWASLDAAYVSIDEKPVRRCAAESLSHPRSARARVHR